MMPLRDLPKRRSLLTTKLLQPYALFFLIEPMVNKDNQGRVMVAI
jgi:hypothetical protein